MSPALYLTVWLSVFVQTYANDPSVSVQWDGLTINYRTEGDVAAGPVVPLDPWSSFVSCFLGPGETGVEYIDGRQVLQADGVVYWVLRQTVENAVAVAICAQWDADRDDDVDLRDFAPQQYWFGRLAEE